MVHGLWDNSRVFNSLLKGLPRSDFSILTPNLRHQFGRVSLSSLAEELDAHILRRYGPEISLDLLGFSMGGLVSRIWLQCLGGARRTNRFISVGTPHGGTLTAQLAPSCLLAGVAEMKLRSPLLKELNEDLSLLKGVECSSYFCRWDLMVFPYKQALLPVGSCFELPVITHKQLISHPNALKVLLKAIIVNNS